MACADYFTAPSCGSHAESGVSLSRHPRMVSIGSAEVTDESSLKRRYFIQFACFCERVERDQSNVLTVHRIANQITVRPSPEVKQPPGGSDVEVRLTFAVGVMPETLDAHTLTLRLRFMRPDGRTGGSGTVDLLFQGGRGAGVGIFGAVLRLDQPGLYWMDIRTNRTLLTRVPLNVIYAASEPSNSPGQSQPQTGIATAEPGARGRRRPPQRRVRE